MALRQNRQACVWFRGGQSIAVQRVWARNIDGEDDIDGPVTKGFGGGGFGGANKVGGSKDVLKPTRKTAFREVRGQYARILSAKSLSFEKMRAGHKSNKQGLRRIG